MTGEESKLHPAEHRAYRELYLACRQLVDRWERLISALEGSPDAEVLERGRERVEQLLEALPAATTRYGLHGGIAAQGLGARIADVRSAVGDRTVDTGMVMRLSVLDIEHVATLLGQLSALASARSDRPLASFCRDWETAIRPSVASIRMASISLGASPDATAAPLDSSLMGRAAHRVGWVVGSVGEAIDRVTGSRQDPGDED